MSNDAKQCYDNLKNIYIYLKLTENACNDDMYELINENDIALLNEKIKIILQKYDNINNNLIGGNENENDMLLNKFLPITFSFEMLLKKLYPKEKCSTIKTTSRIYSLFTDPQFGTNDHSLIGKDESAINKQSDIDLRKHVKFKYAEWKRPFELFENRYNLFINTPQSSDQKSV